MAAGRIFRSSFRINHAAWVGIASGFAIYSYGRKNQRVVNDSPAPGQLHRQETARGHNRSIPAASYQQLGHDGKTDVNSRSKTEVSNTYPVFENDDDSAWANFSRHIDLMRRTMAGLDWTMVGNNITGLILPGWARQIPELLVKLQSELSMKPGSLADNIWQEAADPWKHPEVEWDASVRISNVLCDEEVAYRQRRKRHLVAALAKYLGIDEAEINPEDVPTIAMCGSGGGLRALVAGTGSMFAAQQDGLFDCVTYTSGVSGSCWMQALYHTQLGKQSFTDMARHLKNRVDVHVAFPPPALKLLSSAPTNKYLLSGFVERLRGDPGVDVGLVHIYGLLVASRLMVPRGELDVCDRDLKLSNQRVNLQEGRHPMPIYTAVRHEIPANEAVTEAEQRGEEFKEAAKEKAKREAWFQWFEFTPYEVFCEEFLAGIPTWALGRHFNRGHNVVEENGLRLPEMRLPLMLGIWGSAFCATLSHYYEEIKPALATMAGFDHIDSLLSQNHDDLVKLRPIDPASVPNFVYGMQGQLPPTCPDSLPQKKRLELMDAGMSNNLPIYPLLRPGRDVDIIITFDASADKKKDNWLSVVDGYARQRGVSGWPIGAGWPQSSTLPADAAQALNEDQASTVQDAASKVADANEQKPSDSSSSDPNSPNTSRIPSSSSSANHSPSPPHELSSEEHDAAKSPPSSPKPDELGYCTIWVGSKSERTSDQEPPPTKRLDVSTPDSESSFHLMKPSAAMTLIYFPLLSHQEKVPGVDPETSEFMSTWNSVYTPEQIDKVVDLATANFEEGAERTRRCVKAVYERKKRTRLKREEKEMVQDEEENENGLRGKLRRDGDHFAAL